MQVGVRAQVIPTQRILFDGYGEKIHQHYCCSGIVRGHWQDWAGSN